MYFKLVSVYPADKNNIIQWQLFDAYLPGDYKFHVEKSGSPEGPFTRINAIPVLNTFFYEDYHPLLNKENHLYYRVIAIAPDGEIVTSAPHDLLRNLERHAFLTARDIARKERLRLRKYVGVKCVLLPRKHFGAKCTDCVDPVTDDITSASCLTCFSTRFVGGFFPPIEIYAEINPASGTKVLEQSGFGMSENFNTTARVSNYPLINRGDILIEIENNRRWHCIGAQTTELKTIPIVQNVEIRQIAGTDIEYSIPVQIPMLEGFR